VYAAGLEQDDPWRVSTAGGPTQSRELTALRRHKPGDRVKLVFVDRRGRPKEATITLTEDPTLEVVPAETISGGSLTAAQRAFRERWLGRQ
jgi:S1-C subfamily serine protease